MTEQEMIAAHIAKNGVTKCEPNRRTMSEHQIYQAVRGEDVRDEEIANRLAATDHLDREVWVNADGEVISYG